MESKLQTEKVMIKKEKLSVTLEQVIENDMSLPDYYGDIVKVLSCAAAVNIFSASITGDKAVIDGSVCTRVLYLDGNGKSDVFECAYPFNRSVDVKDASDGDIVSVSAVSDQVTCRAVNQRRADIRGSVTLRVAVTGLSECAVITQVDDPRCHTLQEQAQGSFLLGSIARSYTLTTSEDLTGGGKKLYRSSSTTVVNEIRTIKNKMMIKGSVGIDAVLLGDDGGFVTRRITLPVNQILDMEGIDEETQCCASLSVSSADLRLTPDSPQSAPSLEVSVIVTARVDAYKKASVSLIAQAYSPFYELLCTQTPVRCVTSMRRIQETYLTAAQMDFSSCKAKSVADACVRRIRYSVQTDGNTLICKGNLHFGLILVTENDEKLYFERVADFEYKKQLEDSADGCEFMPDISVNAVSCSVDGASNVSVSAELRIDGFAYAAGTFDAVTGLEKGKEIERQDEDGVVTIYFASKGEKLWDIAKEHGTSVALIQEANELSVDTLAQDCMLIFELE